MFRRGRTVLWIAIKVCVHGERVRHVFEPRLPPTGDRQQQALDVPVQPHPVAYRGSWQRDDDEPIAVEAPDERICRAAPTGRRSDLFVQTLDHQGTKGMETVRIERTIPRQSLAARHVRDRCAHVALRTNQVEQRFHTVAGRSVEVVVVVRLQDRQYGVPEGGVRPGRGKRPHGGGKPAPALGVRHF